jgi:hypothetical protein
MTQIRQINTERHEINDVVMESPNPVIARSAATKQSLTDNAVTMNASSDRDCFAAIAMTARGNVFALSCLCIHFQLSTFNFQFSIFN